MTDIDEFLADFEQTPERRNLYGVRAVIEQLQAELDKHRWIPVEERLPVKADYYNTVRFQVGRVAGMAYWNGKAWRKTPNHRYINKITHWKPMDLPEQALEEVGP